MSKTWSLFCAVIGIIIAVLIVNRNKNNVCKTFSDYYSNRDRNPNCYYNPDHELEVPDIIKRHGYLVEVHRVTTEDGYILTVFRIPSGNRTNSTTRKPVFIQHGISLNGGAFIITGKKSLGFMLADAGYDVWLGNFRGNRYSNNHTYLSSQRPEYWNFSFHEHGVYDLPAQIKLVTDVTKQKIIYIGHSMGTTAGYVYSATYPDEAKQNIDLFVGLAPSAYFKNVRAREILSKFWRWIEATLEYITIGKLYPRPPLPKEIYKVLCFPYPIQMEICQIADMILFGLNYDQNDPETLPVSLQYNIDAVSLKTLSHFMQRSAVDGFHYYDYGEIENTRIYNNSSPPQYNLSNINVANYFIYASNDKVTTPENVERLFQNLPKHQSNFHKLHKINNEHFNHIDIISGRNSDQFVNIPIINLLNKRYFREH